MKVNPVGIIHTPFVDLDSIPKKVHDYEVEFGVVEVYHDYCKGLWGLEDTSFIILLVHLNSARYKPPSIDITIDNQDDGFFATQSVKRPNQIGITIVELIRIEGCNLVVRGVNLLDGTPVLDIRPYPFNTHKPPIGMV